MAKKTDRFERIYQQGVMTTYEIIRDRETGVCYLTFGTGSQGGITPLLDAHGRPVVSPVTHVGIEA